LSDIFLQSNLKSSFVRFVILEHLKPNCRKLISFKFILVKETSPFSVIFFSVGKSGSKTVLQYFEDSIWFFYFVIHKKYPNWYFRGILVPPVYFIIFSGKFSDWIAVWIVLQNQTTNFWYKWLYCNWGNYLLLPENLLSVLFCKWIVIGMWFCLPL
jgi:hypothetical protein